MKLPYIAAAAALLFSLSTAQADGLKPVQAQRIDLGKVSGIAYYTVEAEGFHVVATLANGETGELPLRVQAVLTSGQSVVFSTPGSTMAASVSITIKRHGNELRVERNPQGLPATH
jgi:hypothetical protein